VRWITYPRNTALDPRAFGTFALLGAPEPRERVRE
jgi:hypothetical protein